MSTRVLLVVGAVLVAAGLGVGLGVGLGSSSSTSPTSGTSTGQSEELASIRTACEDWLHGTPQGSGTAQWCTEMTRWMSTYMDRYGVGPRMMWGEPSRLSNLCDRWMSSNPPPGAPTDPGSWCDSMVSWMTTHMEQWSGRGSWGGWMHEGPMGPGPMMGGP